MDDDLTGTGEEEEASPIFRPKSGKNKSTKKSDLFSPGKATAANPRLSVVVPVEEVESVKKDFFAQISFLFQVMKKVENRGFMFRLDFNEFLSKMINSNS